MKTAAFLPIVMLLAMSACRSHSDGGSGSHLHLAMESPVQDIPRAFSSERRMGTPLPAHSSAGELEGTKEVRAQTWAAMRGLKRQGAWLSLGLRVEGERIRLLALHGHEGTGAETGIVEVKNFRSLMDWALYRYAMGQ
ncbi:hypothetical protein Q664_23465 [Archangium violaceum Cb vi76]|uniref:Lipoprotein n=1 Tax=Archangium violaceum Cb vi76 TaxID=1406225 RepID=A0A084SRT7_9BACT|nr:hypothetical protein Q664_23465 [Archangium violaceum Cb vi76]